MTTPAACYVKCTRVSTSGSGPHRSFGTVPAVLEVLRREAEALIKPKEADEAVENKARPMTTDNGQLTTSTDRQKTGR